MDESGIKHLVHVLDLSYYCQLKLRILLPGSGIVATIFGATGFLGRYVVNSLQKMRSQVLVSFRGSEDSHHHLKRMGDLSQIVPMKYNHRDENSIKAVMARANVVINLIARQLVA
ncbi:NADH dehydrogenase [ubiquinone] 1 alpha subcomplex subunit 9, mitochondrial-like isoform X2 [Henckelia pumila]|uniref:NADH dehydrogenase [ubiquinone] 1 alpha subcomplex subunit 9, mitochondrial-like isoform X2 n=1 Tax=Henckelia pumila TaxID=405737 RepID=UPI003C6E8DED